MNKRIIVLLLTKGLSDTNEKIKLFQTFQKGAKNFHEYQCWAEKIKEEIFYQQFYQNAIIALE